MSPHDAVAANDATPPSELVSIRDLEVRFRGEDGGWNPAIEGVSYSVNRGEILGVVGESGCGKSVTAFSLLRLHDAVSTQYSGEVSFEGEDVLHMDAAALRHLRGRQIGMIFQNPMSSLDPLFTIQEQLLETVHVHFPEESRAEALERCRRALTAAGSDDPDGWMARYPHQMSGGMIQRVMIGLALLGDPSLLIADEPTTALDVTTQAQVLRVIRQLSRERDMSVILITHDMGVVAEVCDRVAVMYLGQVVETAPVEELFAHPRHPYTRGLLASTPPMSGPIPERLSAIEGSVPRLASDHVGCRFATRCPLATAACVAEDIDMHDVGLGVTHDVRCIKTDQTLEEVLA
ncbi:ABC transporter ATP-binding protein [Pseudoclavibacter sp. 13-3]|uniref:ABC transporter ATP-binding protein n=1 Tax=Pseudoclavibacter sp. 13-3 TaxID=2901228 RepID=UPI001E47BDC8|nr:ABC transporter ATP-binding protein [Pseudoclavibacter sp. 13-3]MCD7101314.1 ABC transporter ATP-binding protein [Pseudoclavibacter sp. 13-3]